MTTGGSAAVRPLVEDLQRIFSDRLEAVVAYGAPRRPPVPSLVLVRAISFEDLEACAGRASAWRRAGAATPLVLTRKEFMRSLDAFPIEYGQIIHSHEVVFGDDPFAGLTIAPDDLRRACEVQVKSHLVHLREDYLESGGRHGEIAELVRESAPGFAALLRQIARLDRSEQTIADTDAHPGLIDYARRRIGLDPRVVGDLLALADPDDVPAVDPLKLFPAYLAAMERLAEFVDGWRAA